jgi:transcriptional regulator with XRE-family HTH domain
MESFKTIITRRRKELQMTQKVLAEKLNVSDKTISKWETGASYPEITLLPKLSQILQIDIGELLGAEDLHRHDEKEMTEEYDYNRIQKFKTGVFIAVALLLAAIIFFFFAPVHYLFIVLSCLLIIGSLLVFVVYHSDYQTFYRNKYYTKAYDQAYARYVNIYAFLLAILLLIISLALNVYPLYFVLPILLFLLLPLLSYWILRKANFRIRFDRLNIILLVFFGLILVAGFAVNVAFFLKALIPNISNLMANYAVLFLNQLLFYGILLRSRYEKL